MELMRFTKLIIIEIFKIYRYYPVLGNALPAKMILIHLHKSRFSAAADTGYNFYYLLIL